MFPIANDAGKVIAFTGRTLAADDKAGPKYLNSPETAIYSKSRVLFNLDRAKEAIRKLDYAILVEGQMDCIAVYAAGFHNVIASSGTAFTEAQAHLLARFSKKIVVNFDPDTAGAAAAERSLALLVEEEFEIKVLTLEAGFDPDLFRRKRGREAYADALKSSQRYFDYLIDRARATFPARTPEGKVKAVNYLLPHIHRVPSRIARDELAKEMAQRLGIDSAVLMQELRHAAGTRSSTVKPPAEPPVTDAERILIRALAAGGQLDVEPGSNPASEPAEQLDPQRQARYALTAERLHQGLAAESLLEALLAGEKRPPPTPWPCLSPTPIAACWPPPSCVRTSHSPPSCWRRRWTPCVAGTWSGSARSLATRSPRPNARTTPGACPPPAGKGQARSRFVALPRGAGNACKSQKPIRVPHHLIGVRAGLAAADVFRVEGQGVGLVTLIGFALPHVLNQTPVRPGLRAPRRRRRGDAEEEFRLALDDKYDDIKKLIDTGKEKGYLTYDQVNDLIPHDVHSPEDLDDLLTTIGTQGIDVLEGPKLPSSALDKKFEEEGEVGEDVELDLTPGALEKTNDPVRMYLREMGTVPLLTREGEVEIAKRIERGQLRVLKALSRSPIVINELLAMGEDLQEGRPLHQGSGHLRRGRDHRRDPPEPPEGVHRQDRRPGQGLQEGQPADREVRHGLPEEAAQGLSPLLA